MRTSTIQSIWLLPDGTPLHNRLLAALPARDYARIQKHLHMNTGVTGRTLQEHGAPVTDVYFPNGGVFSVTNEMRDGALVEVATPSARRATRPPAGVYLNALFNRFITADARSCGSAFTAN